MTGKMCDVCGAFSDGGSWVHPSGMGALLPPGITDLCPKCVAAVRGAIKDAIDRRRKGAP